MTDEQIKFHTEKILKMTQIEMASLWRSAPIGHPYFKAPLWEIFEKRFKEVGGMTPEISKMIGW